jgi:hypothetical protein
MTTSGVIDTKTGKVRYFGLKELKARDAVIEAAQLYASGYTDGTIDIETQERGHTAIMRSCRALAAEEVE